MPWSSTFTERAVLKDKLANDYQRYKNQWEAVQPEQADNWSLFREEKRRIEVDVVRTDRSFYFFHGDNNPNLPALERILRSYLFFNWDLGYVQVAF